VSVLNSDLEKNTSGSWRKVYCTRQKYNKQPDAQQPKPTTTIVNHCLLPDNLQEESEAFHFPGLVGKTATVKNKTKCTSKPQRNKILIIGDSHTRDCS
jgi:hypothetical protein